MTTPDYVKKMSDFRARIGQHTTLSENRNIDTTNDGIIKAQNTFSKSSTNTFTNTFAKLDTKSIMFYAAFPISIIIILFIFRPGFVCIDHMDENNNITKKILIQKVMIYGLIGGTILSVGIFAYLFKNKKT